MILVVQKINALKLIVTNEKNNVNYLTLINNTIARYCKRTDAHTLKTALVDMINVIAFIIILY